MFILLPQFVLADSLVNGTIASLCSHTFSAIYSGGASGTVYDLIGALLVVGFKHRSILPERVSKALTRGIPPWAVFGTGIGFFEALPTGHAAHIGGLISGDLLATMMASSINCESIKPTWCDRLSQFVVLVGAATTFVGFVHWVNEITTCLSSAQSYLGCYPELRAVK